jgi:hypothetical protein
MPRAIRCKLLKVSARLSAPNLALSVKLRDTALNAQKWQTFVPAKKLVIQSREINYDQIWCDQCLEVHGSKGMVHTKNVNNTTVEVLSDKGYRADPIQNFFSERYGVAYANEWNDFITAAETGKSVKVA